MDRYRLFCVAAAVWASSSLCSAAIIFAPPDQQIAGNTDIGTFPTFDGDDVYIGFTVDWPIGTVGSNEFYVLWFDNSTSQNIGIKGNQGPNGEDFIVRHHGGDSGAYSPTQLSIPSTARLVGHLEKTVSGAGQPYDTFSLWVDPVSETDPTPVFTTDHVGDTSIDTLGMRAANDNDLVFFRNIVVATTFDEVFSAPPPPPPPPPPPAYADSFLFGDPPDPAAGEYAASVTSDLSDNTGRLAPPGGGAPQNPTVAGFTRPWGVDPGGGTSLWKVIDEGLDHPTQRGEAGGAVRFQWPDEVGDRTVFRDLQSPPANGAGEEFWMSALMRLEENDPDFDGYALVGFTESDDATSGDSEGFRVGFVGDGSEMDLVYRSRTRLAPPSGPVTMEDNVVLDGAVPGETYLVLVRGQQDATGGGGAPNDLVSIWLDPQDVSSVGALGVPTLEVADFSLHTNSFPLLSLSGSDLTGAGAVFDEPRLGLSLASVVGGAQAIPEPNTWALLLLGAAGLLWARRRR